MIHGNIASGRGKGLKDVRHCNWIRENAEDHLHDMVKESFKTESFGVKVTQETPWSKEDERAMEIMEATTKIIGGRFETGLLWRDKDPQFPESKSMTFKRLYSVERKMDKDPEYSKKYFKKIVDYQE